MKEAGIRDLSEVTIVKKTYILPGGMLQRENDDDDYKRASDE